MDLIFNSNEKNLFLNNLIDFIHMNSDLKNKKDISFLFIEIFNGICCDNLSYIADNKMSIRRQKMFLDNFFNNLLIWGARGEGIYPDETIFEFYSKKGIKLIKKACDFLDQNILNENLNIDNKNNIIARKNLLLNSLKIHFKKILFVMQNLEIDDKSNNNKRDIMKNSNLNNTNIQEKLITKGNELEEINTNKANDYIINTKIEISDNNLNNENVINNNKFYQKLDNIIGNFKLFRTDVGHVGLLNEIERDELFLLLLKSGIIN